MKSYKTRYRRPHLLPIPYRTQPARLERSVVFLRNLRLSLAAPATPAVRPQQVEFSFAAN
jgi:hypothetical protein